MQTVTGIIVLDKGFVYFGDFTVEKDDWFLIENALNVRRYGTTRGLGQLALNGPTKETELDPCMPIRGRMTSFVFFMECSPDAIENFKKVK
jgi:hypothetical protein